MEKQKDCISLKNLYEKANILFTLQFPPDVALNKSFFARQKSNSSSTTATAEILHSGSSKAITTTAART
jgi:hypothetical protein